MAGNAKRYPTLPETSFLVTFTGDVRQRIVDAFHAASIELRPMKELLAEQSR